MPARTYILYQSLIMQYSILDHDPRNHTIMIQVIFLLNHGRLTVNWSLCVYRNLAQAVAANYIICSQM